MLAKLLAGLLAAVSVTVVGLYMATAENGVFQPAAAPGDTADAGETAGPSCCSMARRKMSACQTEGEGCPLSAATAVPTEAAAACAGMVAVSALNHQSAGACCAGD